MAAAGLIATALLWRARRRDHRVLAATRLAHDDLSAQLERRMGELFSLQELGYILSESLQVDRLAEQTARYVQRFLRADGAVVALAEPGRPGLRVVGADGTLAPLLGRTIEEGDGLLIRAATEERISLEDGSGGPVDLGGGVQVPVAVAAPLRAQGETMGVVAAVAGSRAAFNTEGLWILSTAATQAAVALANGRLFELVHRGKAEWESTFDALEEGIAVVDGGGRIVRANRGLGRMLDRTLPSLMGAEFAPLVADPATQVRDLVFRGPGAAAATLLVRSPGRGRMLRLTAAQGGTGTAGPALVVLVEDVTDQRALEGQLIQSEKMAAIGQLVSGVAHELNNPLTSIAGLSELLLEQARIPAGSREHLRVIHAQAERAGRIVQNLLTFARKGTPERTASDLNDVAARTALLISYELRQRGIVLAQTLADGGVPVMADRYELQQVVLNLLTNAVQAVAAARADGGEVRIETAVEGDVALLRVADNGGGVDPAHVAQLFTPFFTTKDPGEGTGLGLSISYGIVEAHGGRLSYAPADGGGAVFTISLPVHRAPTAAVPRAGRTVLLVDDDPKAERLVAALFAREGHLVEAARSATDALKRLDGPAVDLVVLDARLPGAEGGTAMEAILAAHPELRDRIIVAVPQGAPGTADRLRGEGYRVVPHPYDLRMLRAAAALILGQ